MLIVSGFGLWSVSEVFDQEGRQDLGNIIGVHRFPAILFAALVLPARPIDTFLSGSIVKRPGSVWIALAIRPSITCLSPRPAKAESAQGESLRSDRPIRIVVTPCLLVVVDDGVDVLGDHTFQLITLATRVPEPSRRVLPLHLSATTVRLPDTS